MACLLALRKLMRRSRCIVMVVAILLGVVSAAQAQQRVALVIGNGAYTSEAALPNAVRDAELVAEGFTALKFRVTLHRNLDRAGLKRALQAFETEASGADVAAIYFAGHGIAVDGLNWMLPVDAKLESASHVEDEAFAHSRFIRTLKGVKGLQLVILDACRNNPFGPRLAQQEKAQGGTTRKVATRGLERIPENELPPNQLVAFSAREGQVAQDGPPGANGPYAKALRSRMEKAGTEIGLLFRQVRDDVMAATGNRQEPWKYDNLGAKELYLLPDIAPNPKPPPDPRQAAERDAEHFTRAQINISVATLELYISQCNPPCFYKATAISQIAHLKEKDAEEFSRATTQQALIRYLQRCQSWCGYNVEAELQLARMKQQGGR